MHPARKNNLLLFVCGWKIPRAAENGNIATQCEKNFCHLELFNFFLNFQFLNVAA